MNTCMILSTLLAIVVLLRVIFIMAEMGYYMIYNNDYKIYNDDYKIYNNDILQPKTKQYLRTLHTNILAYEKFDKLHKQVILIAATGRNEYQFNLCYKDPAITTLIETMVREAFPDSTIKSTHEVGNCTKYKLNW